jgi:hypothetical protein
MKRTNLFFLLLGLGIFFLPTITFARGGTHFYDHCAKNPEFNSFAAIDSTPSGTTFTEGDNGKMVAIFEVPEAGETGTNNELSISGTTHKDVSTVFLCSKGKIISLIPTY